MFKQKSILFIKAVSALILFFVFVFSIAVSQDELSRLNEGNDRYISGRTSSKDFAREREDLLKGQKPYAIIVTCSDSRVPPELIFDESLGQLFVIRVAGNVVDPDVLGSIEYAVEHLHCHLLIIMGHESCGAVKATIEGGKVPPNIGALVYKIKPAVKAAKAKHLNEEETLNLAIENNVHIQLEESIKQSKVIKEYFEKGELKIYGAVYNLHTGKVSFEEFKEK
jgi:carbonic anhydrase